jgi:hypothetical protein
MAPGKAEPKDSINFRSSYRPLLLLFICLALVSVVHAQRCYISPASPIALPGGGTYPFSAICGDNVTWTVSGQGTIDGNGVYSAPQTVHAQNQDHGCQVSPNNSPFNVPVDQLPVDSHSTLWLTRALQDHPDFLNTYHATKFYPSTVIFYSNLINNNTPMETMHFYYSSASFGYQDKPFPIPSTRNMVMETGTNVDASAGYDRHLLTINKDTCQETEIYNLYVDFRTVNFTNGSPTQVSWTTNTIWPVPQGYSVFVSGGTGNWQNANGPQRITLTGTNTGTMSFDSSTWGPANQGITVSPMSLGCPTCNSQGGQKFAPTSYAQLGGVDAAGMPINSLSLKLEEWYSATRAGRSDLGHALRTTISNSYLSSRSIWPATLYALGVAGSTIAITGATDGSPTVFTTGSDLSGGLPCDNYTFTAGCTFHVNISGIVAGPWLAAKGDWVATAIDNFHFSIQLDSTQFGSFPGAQFVFDFFPYGATIRLKSSVDLDQLCTSTDLNNWCPYAKVYLNTIKKYGMVVADGTVPADNWDNGAITSEFHPDMLGDAAQNIRSWTGLQPFENYLEVVDRSSQIIYTDLTRFQDSSVNRTYVTVSGSYGTASTDVILQGTTVGTDRERLTLAGGVSYQINAWLNGNVNTALSYNIDNGIPGATVSASGMLTMPNCQVKQRGFVTVTSQVDSDALPLYIEVGCIPVSSDGSYRLAIGNWSGDYRDSTGQTWYGAWTANQWGNFDEIPALAWGAQEGTWEGFSPCSGDGWSGIDSQLYSRSTSYAGDTLVQLVLPNGSYHVTLYGEPGFGGFGPGNTCGNSPGNNVYDWILGGMTVGSWLDGYVLAGNQPYAGYQLTADTTVNDNVLDTSGRTRALSTFGMSWSSLLITPTNQQQPLTITTTALNRGYYHIPYISQLSASNGAPPYTWQLANGSGPLPSGLHFTSGGLIFGMPAVTGNFPITVQVTDTQQNTATKDLTVRVCGHNPVC